MKKRVGLLQDERVQTPNISVPFLSSLVLARPRRFPVRGALFVRGESPPDQSVRAGLPEKDKCISAFTLLELIIALSVGTVLILVVAFSIRMGFFQMEKGSRWLEESHRENSALHFLRQQVTSMRSETVDEDVIFDGAIAPA